MKKTQRNAGGASLILIAIGALFCLVASVAGTTFKVSRPVDPPRIESPDVGDLLGARS